MKAMVYRRFGGPEVLEPADLPEPKLAQNSVLVEIKAAGLNPADVLLQAGLGAAIMDTWFPVIPGWDLAGIVAAVGAGVSEFRPGDSVLGYVRQDILHHGTYAERIAAPVETLIHKPPELGWREAAGLPLAGLTADRAVTQVLAVQPGETVLVHGAAGGVGSLAAQLARLRGARVFGAASPAKHDFLRKIGIEPVVRGEGLAAAIIAHPARIDVILDCAGRDALQTSAALTGPATRVASVATSTPEAQPVFARLDTERLTRLADLAVRGALMVPVAACFPLADAAQAQALLSQGRHGPGKIVLETGNG